MPSPILYDCVFEGGPSNPEDMVFHYVIEYFCLLIMDTSGHGLVGDSMERVGLVCTLVPLSNLMVSFVS